MIEGLISLIVIAIIVGIVALIVIKLVDMIPMLAGFKDIVRLLIILIRALPLLGVNISI